MAASLVSRFRWVVPLALMSVACSDDGESAAQGSDPVECGGELTCSETEMCVTYQDAPWKEDASHHACEPTPAGCGGLELCQCSALEQDYGEQPITGCSLLGGRDIYVTDVTCGDRRCSDTEYCLVEAEGYNEPVRAESCQPLPPGCSPEAKFCGEGGCMAASDVDGKAVIVCIEAAWTRAVMVQVP